MASRGVATATPSVATATPSAIAVGTPAVTAEVPAAAATGGGGGGAIQAAPIVVPVVTFGNGRVPGIPSGRPDALPNAVGLSGGSVIAVVPAAPAPFVPVPVAVFAPPAAVQRVEVPAAQLPSTFLWSPLRHTWPDAALFGLAGLLLAPVAGVWLGYRQARASKSAANIAGR